MGKKNRNRNTRKNNSEANTGGASSADNKKNLQVKFPFPGSKRNASMISSDSDLSMSTVHENARFKLDQSSPDISDQCEVLTTTTTTVSTTFASGSLPSVSGGSVSTAAAVADISAILAVSSSAPSVQIDQSTAHMDSISTGRTGDGSIVNPAAATANAGPEAPAAATAPSVPPLNLTYDDLSHALLQCFARDDVSDKLTDKFTNIVSSLISDFKRQHDKDQDDIKQLTKTVSDLKTEVNDLEQYSRRNSVRINCQNWREFPYEDCERLVLDLSWDLGFHMEPWMIDRCHRTGKRTGGRERDILVKFISYRYKDALIKARSKAGANPVFRNVYINEDLSSETGKLFSKARALKKDQRLYSATTRDGRILVSRFKADPAVVIKTENDLNNIASRGTFANLAKRTPSEDIQTRLLRVAGMPPRQPANTARPPPPPRQPAYTPRPPPPGPQPARPSAPRSDLYRVQQIPPFRASDGGQRSHSRAPGMNTQQGPNLPPPVGASTPTGSRQQSSSFTVLPAFRPVSYSFECY